MLDDLSVAFLIRLSIFIYLYSWLSLRMSKLRSDFFPASERINAPCYCVYVKQPTNISANTLYLFHHK